RCSGRIPGAYCDGRCKMEDGNCGPKSEDRKLVQSQFLPHPIQLDALRLGIGRLVLHELLEQRFESWANSRRSRRLARRQPAERGDGLLDPGPHVSLAKLAHGGQCVAVNRLLASITP